MVYKLMNCLMLLIISTLSVPSGTAVEITKENEIKDNIKHHMKYEMKREHHPAFALTAQKKNTINTIKGQTPDEILEETLGENPDKNPGAIGLLPAIYGPIPRDLGSTTATGPVTTVSTTSVATTSSTTSGTTSGTTSSTSSTTTGTLKTTGRSTVKTTGRSTTTATGPTTTTTTAESTTTATKVKKTKKM